MTSDMRSEGLFASARERRLWTWTVVVVVGIYSTLGLARSVAGLLRTAGVLEGLFVVGALLVVAAIGVAAFKTRPDGAQAAVVVGIVAVYLLVFVRMAVPEERTHLIEYGIVAAFLFEALTERARCGRPVPRPAVLATAIAGIVGLGDEGIQWVLPSRVFDLRDVLFNALAAAMAVIAIVAIRRARRAGCSNNGW